MRDLEWKWKQKNDDMNIWYIHEDTGTRYDPEGYDYRGYNEDGYDREGYNRLGYNREGINRTGFDRKGIHKDTGTEYDLEGYNKDGYDKEGYNRESIDRTGKTREERNEIQKKQRRMWLGLKSKAEKLAKGQMSIEEYIMKSKTSIEDLIVFAKKEHLPFDIIRGLYRFVRPYKTYTKPFNKKEYLSSTIIIINDKEVKPTEQDVDMCIDYLKENGFLICAKTVSDTVRKHLRGEIDITRRTEQAVQENTKTQLEILEEEQAGLEKTLESVEQLETEVTQAENKDKSIK